MWPRLEKRGHLIAPIVVGDLFFLERDPLE
jgi:hypothetical protein